MKAKTIRLCLVALVLSLAFFGCASSGGSGSSDGTGIVLKAKDATIHSDLDVPSLIIEEPNKNLGYWHHMEEYVSWDVEIPETGNYMITLRYAAWADSAGSSFTMEIGGQSIDGILEKTTSDSEGWFAFKNMDVGVVKIEKGAQVLTMKVTEMPGTAVGNVLKVTLTPQ